MEKFDHFGFEGSVYFSDGTWYAAVSSDAGSSFGSGKKKDVAIRRAKRYFDKYHLQAMRQKSRRK